MIFNLIIIEYQLMNFFEKKLNEIIDLNFGNNILKKKKFFHLQKIKMLKIHFKIFVEFSYHLMIYVLFIKLKNIYYFFKL